MSIRLNKVTRDLNMGMSTLVDFLQNKGHVVKNNPNTKITEEEYELLVDHFGKGKESSLLVEQSGIKIEKVDIDLLAKLQFEFNEFKSSIDGYNIIEQIRLINGNSAPLRVKVSGSYLFNHVKKFGFKEIRENIDKIPEKYIDEVKSFYSESQTFVDGKPVYKINETNIYKILVYLTKTCLDTQLLNNLESYYTTNEPKDYKSELISIKECEVLYKIFDFHFEEFFHRIYLQFVGQLIKNITNSYVEFSNKTHFAQEITHETRSESLIEYLGQKNKNSLFIEYLMNHYDKIHSSQKLRLWLYDIYGPFNYELFYPYYFILSNAEKKILKKKALIVMKNMVWNDILYTREPWILISESIKNNQTIRVYQASWKSMWFDDKTINICIDDKPTFSKPYPWGLSEEKFNLIIGSLSGKRIRPLTIQVVDDIITEIDGLQEIEEAIWKVLIKIELKNNTDGHQTYLKDLSNISKLPENIIAKNKCVELLSHYQSKEIPILLVVKMSATMKELEQSLLSCIQINEYEFVVVWESLEYEKSKRTHIFKCNLMEIEDSLSYIKANIINEPYLRSRLNSDNVEDHEFRIKMKYLAGINHDNTNYDIWKSRFYQLFPELRG